MAFVLGCSDGGLWQPHPWSRVFGRGGLRIGRRMTISLVSGTDSLMRG